MDNASAAKDAVFELFQNLDRFSLDDYAPLADTSEAMQRLNEFVTNAAFSDDQRLENEPSSAFTLYDGQRQAVCTFVTERDEANSDDTVVLTAGPPNYQPNA